VNSTNGTKYITIIASSDLKRNMMAFGKNEFSENGKKMKSITGEVFSGFYHNNLFYVSL
jgi:hypothetical protein